jgi:DNA-binding CsgD family transcriptional regulator
VTRIFEKLGVQSRAQAIVLAKDHGLLPAKSPR